MITSSPNGVRPPSGAASLFDMATPDPNKMAVRTPSGFDTSGLYQKFAQMYPQATHDDIMNYIQSQTQSHQAARQQGLNQQMPTQVANASNSMPRPFMQNSVPAI